ncbi:MAG: [Fe-Fe] hydrogenase large subunit C-terminal domain-containing protein [Thermotaleaceae bacterium]
MKKVLTLSKDSCNNCYKCIRICPVKAISFNERGTKIDQSRCIACGRCFNVCPQNPQSNRNNYIKAKAYLQNNKTLIASVDPAYAAYFGENYKRLPGALKQLGFKYVEESTVGIDRVYKEYQRNLLETRQKYCISSSCFTVNLWIQKHYPELKDFLFPVISPMIAHGKILKEKYGFQCKVVFFSPCIGAKVEYTEFLKEGAVDSVFTFYELEKWMALEDVKLPSAEEMPFDDEGSRAAKLFPSQGIFTERNTDCPEGMEWIGVEGADATRETLLSLKEGSLDPAVLELFFCKNGCITGSSFIHNEDNFLKRRKKIRRYAEETVEKPQEDRLNQAICLSRGFTNRKIPLKIPQGEKLQGILREMGKIKRSDELNCGTCGYATCREKAIAIYNGMAQTYMCLPFMRAKSETISNLIFEHSPNLIFLVDRDLKVKNINPAALHHLAVDKNEGDDLYVLSILDYGDFIEIFESKKDILGKKVDIPDKGITVIQNLLYLEKEDVILAILTDITKEEQREKELLRMKKNTVEAAQDVIMKQMRVAQEIASLLGETTAETKVILTKLISLTLNESGEE